MSSEQPSSDVVNEPPPPPPPPPEPEAKAPEPAAQGSSEEVWKEDYDEMIEPEKPAKPRKKNRHWGAIITLVIIIVVLLVWTIISPDIMPEEGDTYTSSPTYANLGNYTGYRDIWAGNMTWGISIAGPETATVGTPITLTVLVTKVYERPGNWFFRGTSIDLKNVSVFKTDGTYLASMSSSSDLGYGVSATVILNLTEAGSHDLRVYVKFMVNEVMRIGYMPLETVQVTPGIDIVPIVVT